MEKFKEINYLPCFLKASKNCRSSDVSPEIIWERFLMTADRTKGNQFAQIHSVLKRNLKTIP